MNTTGNDSWTGNSSTHIDGTDIGPKATIQNGTDTVDNGGTVYVADGTYQEHITINQNLTLIGQSLAGTILDGTNNGILLTINSGLNVSITNFTITNGKGDEGGAIYNQGDLTVINCTFINNTASDGGAIENENPTNVGSVNCTVTGSTFTNNTANDIGGAIYNVNEGRGSVTFTVTGSTFTNNTAHSGGAIYDFNTDMGSMDCTVTGTAFTNNTAKLGGAIYNANGGYGSGIFTVKFSRFYNNTANRGKAILNEGSLNAENNWWGLNNPIPFFSSLIDGASAPKQWLFMTVDANPTSIPNGENSTITVSFNNYSNDGTTYTSYTPLSGQYIPNGSPVNLQTDLGSIGCQSIDKTTVGGIATATLTASELAGTAHIIATTDSQPINTNVLINPKFNLYLNITPDKTNPVVGDTVTYRFKVGNYGPDPAENVIMTFYVPEGLIFTGAHDNIGEKWTYDANTRTITWNLGTVPKGDPDLWVSFTYAAAGDYLINPLLSTSTYDSVLNTNTQSIRVLVTTAPSTKITAATSVNSVTLPSSVNAAIVNTVGMQTTGAPLAPLALAVLSVLGGLIATRKKQ
ncbi:hypothetical protein [uncultured Methanobacterium sp.]|uniref:hypothetical protein n=1 Tax=uncultured Methanobacterium sp. TaxID=176306 RepID=UPI002AA7A2EF|nr:hypothetical protein [uncultured Methanobacterium sp.]